MHLREYQRNDQEEILRLFYDTVHIVNAQDYTREQLDVWASGNEDKESWHRSLQEHYSIVAVEDGQIIGFGDILNDGYLNRLFVHRDYQQRGVGGAICRQLECYPKQSSPKGLLTVHASVTAKPFFEARGYQVVKKQTVQRKGILLTNYFMEKSDKRI